MNAVSIRTHHRKRTARPADVPETARRCLLTGSYRPKAEMVRFVLGPKGHLIPDLTEKLPGRGLWVSADRATLAEAARKNPFSKAAKTRALVDADMPAQVADLLTQRCLQLLGLARAARAAVTREPVVIEALAKGELALVLLASDAGGDIRKKLASAPGLFAGFSREQLGAALGREHLAVVGLKPHPLTSKLQAELARWQGICGASPLSEESSERS